MALKWTDTREIALALEEAYPQQDPRYLNFVDLCAWVDALPDFADASARCGEKVLEAIQLAWIEEHD